jgi:transposase
MISVARTRKVTVAALICGVDVSSISLDARVGSQGAEARFENSPEGVARLIAFCQQHGVELVAMEATGGYERLAFGLLWGSGLPVALLNPRSVRRFAQGMGLEEKTDRIDAGVIAWFAEVKRVMPTEPASAAQARLEALVTRLRQLTELRAAQRNQRLLVSEPAVLESFGELLALLTAQIRALEKSIAELIAADPLWQQLDTAFRSIKGVAGRTVSRLMAEMPEIGTGLQQGSVEAGRAGPTGAGQRQEPRQTDGARRTQQRTHDSLCGGRHRAPLQRRLCGLCGPLARRRKTEEGCSHRLGAQAAGAAQRKST